MKKSIIILLTIISIFTLVACSKSPSYTIQFVSDGVILYEVKHNHKDFIQPVDPLKTGHTFLGWFTIDDESNAFDFSSLPDDDISLYAKWQANTYRLTLYRNDSVYIERDVTYGDPIQSPTLSAPFGYYFKGWLDTLGETYTTMPDKNLALYSTFKIRTYALPVLSIQLPHSIDFVTKDDYVNAQISIINPDETWMIENVSAEFRGRGNGSWWGYEQKSYRIKFNEKQSVFSEESSRHWVIVPGGHDFSGLRSHLAFKITKSVLDNIEYTSENTLVEVFVNGLYHGVYQWMEHVRVDNGRVDIDSDYGINDTGYLLEYDSYASGIEGIDYFWVPGLRYAFTVHSPDPQDYPAFTDEPIYRGQVTYIKNYLTQVSNAIFNNDFNTLLNLVDMDSMVDMYIIHELFKNTDTGWSSFYMYKKPNGKLFFGPIWDFDFTAGISRGDSSTSGIYVGDSARYHTDFTSSEWFISLMTQPAFISRFKSRYQAVTSDITEVINHTFELTDLYHQSFSRDALKWQWHNNYSSDQQAVKQWLISRNQWLNNYTIN